MPEVISISSFPTPLTWATAPVAWKLTDGGLNTSAGPHTDLFISPAGAPPTLNAPRLLGPVEGDFLLSARVTVDFQATFDAGTLLVWRNEHTWAKLCYEFSPRRQPMVVSVITRGVSDDANGFTHTLNSIWLRVARMGAAFAFHASLDGQTWELIRHFAIDAGSAPLVGFVAQSPTGAGCSVTFDDIRFAAARLGDIRSGE